MQEHAADIGKTMRNARLRADLGLREVARRAGTSHATLSAYENGRKIPSVATFLRILEACSYSVEISLKPRIRENNGLSRADELAAVLELAAQFPAEHTRQIQFPRFQVVS